MARPRVAKQALLGKLQAIQYVKPEKSEQERFDQVSLAASLLLLADIGHEQEYALCCSVAKHLVGEVHEPEDATLAEE